MAIQFARIQYISRSSGGNACLKAAYNERSKIECDRTGQVFNFSKKDDLSYHEILLPEGVDEKFKSTSYLWNSAEKAEKRKDSQVGKESVIALPDDKCITHEDRIEITKRYAQALFVSKGLAAQIDIHAPHDGEKNWHAHILATTRGFTKDGKELSSYKARETDPTILKGYIQKEITPGEVYAKIQNDYFKERALDLRVDPTGIVSQIHIGPVRMRRHMSEALERADLLRESNESSVREPKKVLQKLTQKQSVFTEKEVDRFLIKHVHEEEREEVKQSILSQKDLISLFDKTTGEATGFFTTATVLEEERQIHRLAQKIDRSNGKNVSEKSLQSVLQEKTLSPEQEKALRHVISQSQGLSIVEGRAGTGKSFTMQAIRDVYEKEGLRVIGLAPTNVVAQDMDGFQEAMTVHSFLFRTKNNRLSVGKNTVLMVDEAAMLGNTAFSELMKEAYRSGSKMVLFGDGRQLSSVERGGGFDHLVESQGSAVLSDVRRQHDWQKEVSESLSDGRFKEAFTILQDKNALSWQGTKEAALQDLLNHWSRHHDPHNLKDHLVLAPLNRDVDTINSAIQEYRLSQGELGENGVRLETQRGPCIFFSNDRICLTQTDKKRDLSNGQFGTILDISPEKITLKIDEKDDVISFNPVSYTGLKLGYAATVYKSQGKTIKHVSVLHDKSTNAPLTYVSLSRQKSNITLFVSREETPTLSDLIKQSSRDKSRLSTFDFTTQDDLEKKNRPTETSIDQVKNTLSDWAEALTKSFKDRFGRNRDFYQVSLEKSKTPSSPQVIAKSEYLKEEGLITETKETTETPKIHSSTTTNVSNKTQPSVLEKNRIDYRVIEDDLKTKIADLAYNVLGKPTHQNGHEWRYGRKGSVSIHVSGSKQGLYANFESGVYGGAISLIKDQMKMETKEAFQWAHQWLGHEREMPTTSYTHSPQTTNKKADEKNWTAVFPVPDHALNPDILTNPYLSYMAKDRTITDQYVYKDKQGKILGYVVRLEDQDGNKITPTLTYCESDNGKQYWRWQGFGENRPLYNLDKLTAHPEKSILIVEGEKTATAAQKIFPDHVVVTWPGGTGSVQKADWSPLIGRNVIIWPDNDEPGFKASDAIKTILTDLNKKADKKISPSVVNLPKDLPSKWDLADPLPRGMKTEDLQRIGNSNLLQIPSTALRVNQGVLSSIYTKNLEDKIQKTTGRSLEDFNKAMEEFRKGFQISPISSQVNTSSPVSDLLLKNQISHSPSHLKPDKPSYQVEAMTFAETVRNYQLDCFKNTPTKHQQEKFNNQTCEFLKNERAVNYLKTIDPNMVKSIEKMARQLEEERQIKMDTPTLTR